MKKKFIFLLCLMLIASNFVFAASDDFGVNEFLSKGKDFLMAIGGALMVLSLVLWAIKAIVAKNIQPNDWKSLGVIFGAGVLMLVAGAVVAAWFPSLGVIA